MKPKLLVVVGTTSTGKTDLAISIAKKINGELISADSRQLYKYLDIGTGKLPGSFEKLNKKNNSWEIDEITVRLYDVALPRDRFNLYQYVLQAKQAVNEIIKLKKLPILVGGTGLYIRSLIEGISDFGSQENSDLRVALESLALGQIIEKIQKINPQTIKNLNNSDLNNKRRLIRIYEKLVTPKTNTYFAGLEQEFDILKIGLQADRSNLKARIKKRLVSRINNGMIEESKTLLEKGVLTHQRMDELGLEYRYISKFLKDEIKSLDELIEILSTKISQYAKRQETWFRKEKNVLWFDISNPDVVKQVEKQIADWYNSAK